MRIAIFLSLGNTQAMALGSLLKVRVIISIIPGTVLNIKNGIIEHGAGVRPEYLTHVIKAALTECGFDNVRLHDLRHTAASILARRLSPKQIQEFLGHEDVKTTLDIYTHITDQDKITTSQVMNGVLKNVGFCSEKCSES